MRASGDETLCLEALRTPAKKDGHNLVAAGRKIANEGVHHASASFLRRAPACWTLIPFICLRGFVFARPHMPARMHVRARPCVFCMWLPVMKMSEGAD